MPKKMLIDATHAEETRVVVVDGNKVEEFDFESENKRQLAGNIYLAKVTRVEPSLQAAFVDYGGNRHGFLAFSEIHPDYYQIPVADRLALMEEERAYAEAQAAKEDEDEKPKRRTRSRSRSKTKAEDTVSDDATVSKDADTTDSDQINGMETVDLDDEEGSSPMERVGETPVEEPAQDGDTAADEKSEASGDAAQSDDTDRDDSDDADDGDDDPKANDASSRDDSIESVADDDDHDDLRTARKPRPKRYKIQEVVKVRQILLVQVVKEERGNKGAALTTYLSLAGRYCVLMPNTARGGGISRKITNAADRKKLKEIANEIQVPKGAGLIVRTAGAQRTKAEIKRDYEYLQRLWEQIRELTLKSIAPAKIYEEGDLIKRSIRDLYNREIDEVFVEGERGYRIAKDFMKMIMPSHAKNVKLYSETLPLFARYQVESYLSGMFNPTVQLPSGGYIVIGVTEALVAIDVNSGRATKEGSIEQTATKTNLEAAAEVARQLRLRDLAGLIVIDFIDMDERRNNAAVEKLMKDKLKTDRARIQVGRISGFGLMEMSRQRLRPGMIEATTQPCHACHGTGLIRSDDNLALSILRQIEEEGTRKRSREVLITAPVGIANFLMNQKREHIAHIEGRYGMSVRIEGDPALVSPDFTLEKFKTATRVVTPIEHVVSVDTSIMDEVDDMDIDVATEADAEVETADAEPTNNDNGAQNQQGGSDDDNDAEGKPKRRRRRRRRRGGKANGDDAANGDNNDTDSDGDNDSSSDADKSDATVEAKADVPAAATNEDATQQDKPKRTRSRTRKPKADAAAEATVDTDAKTSEAADAAASDADSAEEAPKPKRTRTRKPKAAPVDAAEDAPKPEETPAPQEQPAPEPKPEPEVTPDAPTPEPAKEPTPIPTPEPTPAQPSQPAEVEPTPAPTEVPDSTPTEIPAAQEIQPEPPMTEVPQPQVAPQAQPEKPAKPKRRGWWSLGG
ncbi:MAG: Rne/Rng family ribonuclease [Sulfitobacter litoralis]|jgi:ribonuclease E|uniref:Rne/Rng family ribonuclease n=1 Tax=Sulfitobacter TaxID=60136 RepID=UPI001B609233|nr:ribonuclease E/G [Sulfitobacter sp. M22]MBQ0766953.1 Rne/Rng family ribonuclease [Sulfitobacter litoralis]MCF7725812.1 Rne/Rng family ribonuclease [Sulfitobacter sp. M22]MCF7777138.1 Rne/Rng family ribonuclease [Sulfitobacter sp. M220]